MLKTMVPRPEFNAYSYIIRNTVDTNSISFWELIYRYSKNASLNQSHYLTIH